MNCDSVQPFIEAYVDRELDAANRLQIEDHLGTCSACASLRARVEALHSVVASQAPRYRAPDTLKKRIEAELRSSALPTHVAPKARTLDWRWAALAAIAASILVSITVYWQVQSRQGHMGESQIVSEIVSSHIRSLMLNHLVDQPSSDQHTVKPWFNGKLDFSPEVKNLDAQGFILAGGRLDYMGGRPVAAIVYRRRQHVINVFVWPSSQSPTAPRSSVPVKGFDIVQWISSGLHYCAISDLNQQELNSFGQLWVANQH